MQHIQSTVEVFFTNDYSRFKMINGNRQLNEVKINRIIRDIEDGIDVLKYYPIQVSEKNNRLEIVDGQHRFYICKKLKRPVYYILLKEDRRLTDIAKINSNTEKWATKDFINCYVQLGNKHYQQLQDFMDQYGFNASVSMRLLYFGDPGTELRTVNISQIFHRGEFEVKFLQEAIDIAELCKSFESFPSWQSKHFIQAIYKISKAEKVNIIELATKFKNNPDMLTRQVNYKEYIFLLERLFNVGKHNRVVIY
jgi:hypothetical protein